MSARSPITFCRVAAGAAAADDADDAGSPDARHHLVAAEILQLLGHRRRGAVDVVEQLRDGHAGRAARR